VIRGRGENKLLLCVTNFAETTSVGSRRRDVIATQCCETDGTCRRQDDNGECIGNQGKRRPQPATYEQAFAMCDALGLKLCDKSCSGTGCNYNRYPVWTGLECPAHCECGATEPEVSISDEQEMIQRYISGRRLPLFGSIARQDYLGANNTIARHEFAGGNTRTQNDCPCD